MKKILNIMLIASLLSTAIISCEQIGNDPSEINGTSNIDMSLNEPINSLLKCPDNLEIDEFNMKLLDRANNLVTAFNSKTDFKDQIISLYDHKPIMAFDSIYSQYKKISSIDRKVTYNDVEYEVGVRFFNYDKCNPSKNPIVCIGTEIPNLDPIYEDNIVGWIIGEDGKNQEILVTEEFAENTEHPLFIVVNGVYDKPGSSKLSNQSEKKSVSTMYGLEIYGEKITERYEGSGDSEYNVSWRIDTWEDGEYDGIMSPYRYEHIHDITKTQVNNGVALSYDFQFYELYYPNFIYSWSDTSRKLFCGVTYEHDWYASLKQISIWSTYFWDDLVIEFRASGSNEYYQTFICDNNGYFILDLGGSQSWSSYDETISEKGYVKIRTVSQ